VKKRRRTSCAKLRRFLERSRGGVNAKLKYLSM
jgi:hypothetical protein